jgi:hypothetical protein
MVLKKWSWEEIFHQKGAFYDSVNDKFESL